MKVTNPHTEEIAIVFSGQEYRVPAGESISGVPADAAQYWQSRVHQFIVVSDETPVAQVEEKVEEELPAFTASDDEIKEMVDSGAAVVVEKPKVAKKKAAKK